MLESAASGLESCWLSRILSTAIRSTAAEQRCLLPAGSARPRTSRLRPAEFPSPAVPRPGPRKSVAHVLTHETPPRDLLATLQILPFLYPREAIRYVRRRAIGAGSFSLHRSCRSRTISGAWQRSLTSSTRKPGSCSEPHGDHAVGADLKTIGQPSREASHDGSTCLRETSHQNRTLLGNGQAQDLDGPPSDEIGRHSLRGEVPRSNTLQVLPRDKVTGGWPSKKEDVGELLDRHFEWAGRLVHADNPSSGALRTEGVDRRSDDHSLESLDSIPGSADAGFTAVRPRSSGPTASQLLGLLGRFGKAFEEAWRLYLQLSLPDQTRLAPELIIYFSNAEKYPDLRRAIGVLQQTDLSLWSREDLAGAIRIYTRAAGFSWRFLQPAVAIFMFALETNRSPVGLGPLIAFCITHHFWTVVHELWIAYYDAGMPSSNHVRHDIINALASMENAHQHFHSFGQSVDRRIAQDVSRTQVFSGLISIAATAALRQNVPLEAAPAILRYANDPEAYRKYLTDCEIGVGQDGLVTEIYDDYRRFGTRARVDAGLLKSLLDCFFLHNHIPSLRHLHDDFVRDNGSLNEWGFCRFIVFYADRGDVDRVKKLVKAWWAFSPRAVHNETWFANLMNAYAQRGDYIEVERIFWLTQAEHHLIPDVTHWNIVLKSLARAGQYNRAIDTFAGLCQATSPSSITYATMMSIAARPGDLDYTLKLFDSLLLSGFKMTTTHVESMVSAYCQVGRLKDAEKLCQVASQCIDPDGSRPWNRMLHAYSFSRNLAGIRRVLGRMHQFRVRKDSTTYLHVLNAFVKTGNVMQAHAMLEMGFKRKVFKPTARHVAVVMTSLMRQPKYLHLAKALPSYLGSARSMDLYTVLVQALFKITQMSYQALDLEKLRARELGLKDDQITRMEQRGIERLTDTIVSCLMHTPVASLDDDPLATHQSEPLDSSTEQDGTQGRTLFANDILGLSTRLDLDQTVQLQPRFFGGILVQFFQDAVETGKRDALRRSVSRSLKSADDQSFYIRMPSVLSATMRVLAKVGDFGSIRRLIQIYMDAVPHLDGNVQNFPITVQVSLVMAYLAEHKFNEALDTWEHAFQTAVRTAARPPGSDQMLPAERLLLRHAVTCLQLVYIEKGDLASIQALLRRLLDAGFALDRNNWNLAVEALVREDHLVDAFTICEKFLIQNWIPLRPEPDTSFYQLEKRYDPLIVMPNDDTFTMLARKLHVLRSSAITSADAAGVLSVVIDSCPRTLSALERFGFDEMELQAYMDREQLPKPSQLDILVGKKDKAWRRHQPPTLTAPGARLILARKPSKASDYIRFRLTDERDTVPRDGPFADAPAQPEEQPQPQPQPRHPWADAKSPDSLQLVSSQNRSPSGGDDDDTQTPNTVCLYLPCITAPAVRFGHWDDAEPAEAEQDSGDGAPSPLPLETFAPGIRFIAMPPLPTPPETTASNVHFVLMSPDMMDRPKVPPIDQSDWDVGLSPIPEAAAGAAQPDVSTPRRPRIGLRLYGHDRHGRPRIGIVRGAAPAPAQGSHPRAAPSLLLSRLSRMQGPGRRPRSVPVSMRKYPWRRKRSQPSRWTATGFDMWVLFMLRRTSGGHARAPVSYRPWYGGYRLPGDGEDFRLMR